MTPDKKYRLIVFKIIKRKTLKSKTLDWPSKRRLSNSVKGRYNKIQTKQIKHFNEQSVNQIKKTNMHYKWLSFKTTAINHIFIFIIEFPCQDFIIRFTIWNILQKKMSKKLFFIIKYNCLVNNNTCFMLTYSSLPTQKQTLLEI